MEETHLTRKELYDLVWSEPMLSISKKYEISDTGLRKLCIRMNIPVPRIGHWQKIAAGKKCIIGKFIEEYKGEDKITLQVRDPNQVKTQPLKATPETYPDIDFRVPKKLIDPDKLTIEAEKLLRERLKDSLKRRPDFNDLINCWGGVSILVSPKTMDRALCFMDTLIKVFKNRGHSIIIERDTYVVIGKEKIKIALREKTTQSTVTKGTWTSAEHSPNGKLCLKMDIRHGKEWQDGKTPLEDQLPSILEKVESTAEQRRIQEIEWEKQRRQQEIEDKLKRERDALEEKELKEFRTLMSQAIRWQQMTILRTYIHDMEKLDELKNNTSEERKTWISWAKKKADWYDPSINAEDDLLRNVNKHTLAMKKTEYASYYNSYSDTYGVKEDNFWKPFWSKFK